MAPGKEYEIQVANHPLQNRLTSLLESSNPNPEYSYVVPILFGIFLTVGLALFAASFIVFPVEEKLCQVRPHSYSDPKITNIPLTFSLAVQKDVSSSSICAYSLLSACRQMCMSLISNAKDEDWFFTGKAASVDDGAQPGCFLGGLISLGLFSDERLGWPNGRLLPNLPNVWRLYNSWGCR
jgi:hypothetical protein